MPKFYKLMLTKEQVEALREDIGSHDLLVGTDKTFAQINKKLDKLYSQI
jgi:hypothetical protein